MKKLKFIVEKTGDGGFSAYREEKGDLIATLGDTVPELKTNIVEAYNLYKSETPKEQITVDDVVLSFDIGSFFEFYKEITTTGISKRSGVNRSLLAEYANGKRKPSDKQVKKILIAVKEFGKELTELEIV